MIGYIKGKVVEIGADYIILENNDIGYKLNASSNTISHMQLDEEKKVFTKMIVRDDDISLCGFHSKDEEEMFNLLTSVSKIGTKVGMSILSFATPAELSRYIATNDTAALSKAPGVGKKTAQRIVLELKDKIKKIAFEDDGEVISPVETQVSNDEDGAVEALMQLGYSKAEAQEAVLYVKQPGMELEDIIKKSLEYIMKTSMKF
ncbi:Holliday junction DNA helicase subunit RuvA [Peptostreptococcus russellii]|uniref:Holliday junction branch migration complex subunit RuvA n=1 Tax=Peptostreptococcus russellii TaxID=215200 RepID=A0A1H8I8N5_9FIRM|nr:Holliday junction branch migration protein RuvA [Peptostreptococcus russellii]SEN64691.1 Holliday junction DNA helicase subunit RuvA [Peptostreptococcus russellii]